ncbi:MAG: VOC family protein [Bdellovibrionales bacterium]|nr:VOC family protein [Bdellovibrionales bacterium]
MGGEKNPDVGQLVAGLPTAVGTLGDERSRWRLDHVGLVVPEIPHSGSIHGVQLEGNEMRASVPRWEVEIVVARQGDQVVEFLCPVSETSAIARFLSSRGEGFHHVAYSVDGLSSVLAELRGAGLRTTTAQPVPGVVHSQVIFLNPRDTGGVLIELCERGSRNCRPSAQ